MDEAEGPGSRADGKGADGKAAHGKATSGEAADAGVLRMADAVAAEFDLGQPLAAPRRVHGGGVHLMWRLRTANGDWAVKRFNRSREAWWMAGYLVAAEVERVAWKQGVPIPRPVEPLHPVAPLMADLELEGFDTPVSFHVHEWRDGRSPSSSPPDLGTARWIGRVLAQLHTLPHKMDPAGSPVFEQYGVEHWSQWLDEAPDDVPDGFAGEVRAYLPDVGRALALIEANAGEGALTPVFTHRDVKPDNLLLTSDGPLLVDWDDAGLDTAESETVRAALAFSRYAESDRWDRGCFIGTLRAYREAGGVPIPDSPAVFTGELRQRVNSAAFLLYRALGHRPVSPAERVTAYSSTVKGLEHLRLTLGRLDEWRSWVTASCAAGSRSGGAGAR